MTDHRAAAQAALAAADQLPGDPTRTELLLEALTYAVLAANTAAPEPAGRVQQLLALIRREGGQWDAQRTVAAYAFLDLGAFETSRARTDLKTLAEAGFLTRVDDGRKPVYEVAL